MIINNYNSLVSTKLRKDALDIAICGVESVMPEKVLPQFVSFRDNKLIVKGESFDTSKGKIYIIGGGKAAGHMALALEKIIPLNKIEFGFVNSIEKINTKKIVVNVASHPIPDERGLSGLNKMLEIKSKLNEGDIVICLLSGGGSALLPDPPRGISLQDLKIATELMLKRGADTYELNVLRKHLSIIKGGKLTKLLKPAKIISLFISDKVDPRDDIAASGSTTPDPYTFKDAMKIIKKYNLESQLPKSIKNYISDGVKGKIEDTLKENDPSMKNVYNYILADYNSAILVMKEKASSLGFKVKIREVLVGKEVEVASTKMGVVFKEAYLKESSPFAIIYAGETPVKVVGNGVGGRCQEFVARLIEKINGLNECVVVSLGSDGIDFVPGVGGAMADSHSYEEVRKRGLDINKFVANNNSNEVHKQLNSLIFTGPSNTNVGDLHIYLQDKRIGK